MQCKGLDSFQGLIFYSIASFVYVYRIGLYMLFIGGGRI